MQELDHQTRHDLRRHLITGLARSEAEVAEAQRLRYKVFAGEMGASLAGSHEGMDRDIFDKYCDHLVVRESDENKVVGTHRLLPPDRAQQAGGYDLQAGFDMTRLLHLRDRMVEAGRSCLHANHRNGATVAHLCEGLARYMQQGGYDYLIGCASISIADGGHVAASLYRKLCRIYSAPVEYSVFPRCPLPLHALDQYLDAPVPPLLKGYLRLGGHICGEPAWNADFNTADLFILLPMSRLRERQAKHR